MSFGCPLHTLCRDQLTDNGASPNAYQRAVQAVFQGETPDLSFLSDLKLTFDDEGNVSPRELIDRWYSLLGGSLLSTLSGQTPENLHDGIRALSRVPFWSELQIIPALKSLTEQLAGMAPAPVHPKLTESGAALFESGGHWPWADIPFTRTHAELGLFWCLLGMASNNEALIDSALRLAEWQCHTLDYDGMPFIGLFNPENEASLTLQLTFNYLLFRAVATAKKAPRMAALARQQADHLKSHIRTVPLIALLLEQWLEQRSETIEEELPQLAPAFSDPSLSLVGIRTPERTVITTLSGGNTGLGAFRCGDAVIVNYGPQRLPLGESRSFGIESGFHTPHKTELKQDGDIFSINRAVRLVSGEEPSASAALYQVASPAGLWAEIKQQYSDGFLNLDASFLGYESLEEVAFVYYAKGVNCMLCHGQLIKPRSLDRYRGKPQPATIQGHEGTVTIVPDCGEGEMQVIPLSGGEDFWGSDFLIAFRIDPNRPRCQWKISL
jgi:hypothetical protein